MEQVLLLRYVPSLLNVLTTLTCEITSKFKRVLILPAYTCADLKVATKYDDNSFVISLS